MIYPQATAPQAPVNPTFGLGLGLGGAGSGFSPVSIAGLLLWAKADAGTWQLSTLSTPAVADGDPVGGWVDQAGLGHNLLQATGANRPTLKLAIQNSLPIIRFNGSNNYLRTATYTDNQPLTRFVVCHLLSVGAPATNDVMVDGFSANTTLFFSDTTPQTGIYAGAQIVDGANDPTSWGVATLQYNTTTSIYRWNRVQKASGSVSSTNSAGMTVGANGAGSRATQIDVGEVIEYTGALSAYQMLVVETYLKNRWGTP